MHVIAESRFQALSLENPAKSNYDASVMLEEFNMKSPLDCIQCFAHFRTESKNFTIIFSFRSLANHAEIHVLISLLVAYDNVPFFVFVSAPVFVFVESQHVPSGTSF